MNYVRLDGDYSENIEWLEDMKKVPLYVKSIKIRSNNADELENLTDPNLHNVPINKLDLELNSINISSKTIENLKAIYPSSITLETESYLFCNDESKHQALFKNFTKLLSNLDQTSLEMDFNKYDYRIKLELNDVFWKVVESKKECSYIRAKSVEILCKDEDFCWIK